MPSKNKEENLTKDKNDETQSETEVNIFKWVEANKKKKEKIEKERLDKNKKILQSLNLKS